VAGTVWSVRREALKLSPAGALDDFLASIEAGRLTVPKSLRADVRAAVDGGRPADVDAWANRMADGIASSGADCEGYDEGRCSADKDYCA